MYGGDIDAAETLFDTIALAIIVMVAKFEVVSPVAEAV